jgi:protein-L-isoaspartate(D-aspartate) O-methyltransferase
VERIAGLAVKAQGVLNRLGAYNVRVRTGDGSLGWPEAAPFDKIIVTAAADRLPEALREQLAVGGRLVAPVDDDRNGQVLRLIVRGEEGWEESDLDACRFVPLVRHGRMR